jgi:hypothetical protein
MIATQKEGQALVPALLLTIYKASLADPGLAFFAGILELSAALPRTSYGPTVTTVTERLWADKAWGGGPLASAESPKMRSLAAIAGRL